MKYLLIDTNSWIDLYLEIREEKNLEQLLKWEKDGKVKLLLPETLAQEFTRQKKIQLNLLDKKINDISNTADRDTINRLKDGYSAVENKITRIEAVLLNAVKIPNTKLTHQVVGERYTRKLPPFHNNLKSHNDAYIYFSTIEYFQKKKIGTFVFITRNTGDFGAPENANTHLHAGLLVPGIEVQYFSPAALGVNRLQKELGADAVEADGAADYTEIFYFFPKDEEKNVVDLVYRALDKYHDQLPFIPTHLLARVFPFKVDNFRHPESYHSAFRLNTNNEALMKYFSSLRIGKMNSVHFKADTPNQKIKKIKEKIGEIILKLNANLIYDMDGIGNGLSADLRLLHHTVCDCVRCAYNRFDIYRAFTLLDSAPQLKDTDSLKQAYMYYQFQHYNAALKLFFVAYLAAVDKGQQVLMFICLTNLKRLVRLIHYYGNNGDAQSTEIISVVGRLSLRKVRMGIFANDPFVNEVVDWIADDYFYSRALAEITSTVEKIRDHHNIQLRGGHSSNSNFDVLVSQFAELDSFVEINNLVYNNYLEFEKAADKLAEGLFMCYSFNDRQSQRLEFINDYLVSRIIMFAKTESIIKYYNRFVKGGLQYREGPAKKSRLPFHAQTFFSGLNELYRTEVYKKTAQLLFFDKNRRILNNFLVMLTLAKDVYDYGRIFETLLPVMEIEQLMLHEGVGSVSEFIAAKGNYIPDALLNEFLRFAIQNKQFHEQKVFSALSGLAVKKKKKVIVTDPGGFNAIKNNFLGKCALCGHIHTDILMPLMPLLKPAFHAEMHQMVLQSLDREFNADVYYTLAIGGVIDYRLHLEQFRALCERPLKKANAPVHPFIQGEAVLYRLSELLNIYFKNELGTKDEFFNKFKGYSNYYDWLLDLDGFNYKKFNPLWVLEYQTVYYLERIFASESVKNYVSLFLKKQKHAVLADLFIRYG